VGVAFVVFSFFLDLVFEHALDVFPYSRVVRDEFLTQREHLLPVVGQLQPRKECLDDAVVLVEVEGVHLQPLLSQLRKKFADGHSGVLAYQPQTGGVLHKRLLRQQWKRGVVTEDAAVEHEQPEPLEVHDAHLQDVLKQFGVALL